MDLKEVQKKIESGEIKSEFVEDFTKKKNEDFKMSDTPFEPPIFKVSKAEEKPFEQHLLENAEAVGYTGHAPAKSRMHKSVVTAGENTTKISFMDREE